MTESDSRTVLEHEVKSLKQEEHKEQLPSSSYSRDRSACRCSRVSCRLCMYFEERSCFVLSPNAANSLFLSSHFVPHHSSSHRHLLQKSRFRLNDLITSFVFSDEYLSPLVISKDLLPSFEPSKVPLPSFELPKVPLISFELPNVPPTDTLLSFSLPPSPANTETDITKETHVCRSLGFV